MPDTKKKPWLDAKLTTEEQVYKTMLKDFPPEAIEWVKHAVWKGPVDVPLGEVDFSHEKSWAAWREKSKVARFRKKMKKKLARGKRLQPAILVKTPHNREFIIIDGHHRTLAARELGVPTYAFVGYVNREQGPWLVTHSKQKTVKEGSDPYGYSSSKDR